MLVYGASLTGRTEPALVLLIRPHRAARQGHRAPMSCVAVVSVPLECCCCVRPAHKHCVLELSLLTEPRVLLPGCCLHQLAYHTRYSEGCIQLPGITRTTSSVTLGTLRHARMLVCCTRLEAGTTCSWQALLLSRCWQWPRVLRCFADACGLSMYACHMMI